LIYLRAGDIRHIVEKLSIRDTTSFQTSSKVRTWNYGPPKLRESQLWRFWDSHLGVLGQNETWMWASWRGTKYIIKGEGGGFRRVRAVVSLVSLSCMWLVLAPKMLQLCTNHLVLVLCRFVWVIEACQFFLVPSRSSSTPLHPSKVLWAKERPDSLLFYCFQFETHIWIPQGVGSVSV